MDSKTVTVPLRITEDLGDRLDRAVETIKGACSPAVVALAGRVSRASIARLALTLGLEVIENDAIEGISLGGEGDK